MYGTIVNYHSKHVKRWQFREYSTNIPPVSFIEWYGKADGEIRHRQTESTRFYYSRRTTNPFTSNSAHLPSNGAALTDATVQTAALSRFRIQPWGAQFKKGGAAIRLLLYGDRETPSLECNILLFASKVWPTRRPAEWTARSPITNISDRVVIQEHNASDQRRYGQTDSWICSPGFWVLLSTAIRPAEDAVYAKPGLHGLCYRPALRTFTGRDYSSRLIHGYLYRSDACSSVQTRLCRNLRSQSSGFRRDGYYFSRLRTAL